MAKGQPGEENDSGEKKAGKRPLIRVVRPQENYSAQFGSGNKNNIVGKFNVQIILGSVSISAPLLILLILVLIGGVIYYKVSQRGPSVMTGSFKIAVADFGQPDAQGKIGRSTTGDLISQRLYEGLRIELDSLPPADQANFHTQVWQDSMDVTQKSVTLGVIPGDTPKEREANACILAHTIHANIVIYGNLPADTSNADFIPQFAICDDAGLRVNEDEIVGAHNLIQGLSTQLISQMGHLDTDLAVNSKINSWTNSLSLFSIGILYDLQGQPDLALGVFQQALSTLKSGSAPPSEVLYFFIGREELTLANITPSQAANPDPQKAVHLANAETAFKQSVAINPAYARAYIGLAGVYFIRAEITPSAGRLKGPDLPASIQNYQQALAQAPNSPGALLDTKARLGLVSAWILQGEALRDTNQVADAASTFDRAIQAASDSIQPLIESKQIRVLAQAYLALGEAYHEQGNLKLMQGDVSASKALFQQASQNYGLCIQQKDAAITDQTLADTIVRGFCVPYKQSVDSSLAQLK